MMTVKCDGDQTVTTTRHGGSGSGKGGNWHDDNCIAIPKIMSDDDSGGETQQSPVQK